MSSLRAVTFVNLMTSSCECCCATQGTYWRGESYEGGRGEGRGERGEGRGKEGRKRGEKKGEERKEDSGGERGERGEKGEREENAYLIRTSIG